MFAFVLFPCYYKACAQKEVTVLHFEQTKTIVCVQKKSKRNKYLFLLVYNLYLSILKQVFSFANASPTEVHISVPRLDLWPVEHVTDFCNCQCLLLGMELSAAADGDTASSSRELHVGP